MYFVTRYVSRFLGNVKIFILNIVQLFYAVHKLDGFDSNIILDVTNVVVMCIMNHINQISPPPFYLHLSIVGDGPLPARMLYSLIRIVEIVQ